MRLISLVLLMCCTLLQAQEKEGALLSEKTLSGLKFRNIGPAFSSGRIADIAIHPQDENTWYVAVGSGGVWKTGNAGVTWTPVFDHQGSYSIGCVTVDPNNPHTVWVGTGENVGGRHVGYGDGIYKSTDDGKTWKNMGLKTSEHISKVIVRPGNSNVVYVAAQGPLWSKGGERGFYLTSDGGKTWKKTLGDNEWTGVTDIALDPRNPDLIYAAAWQRLRNVASYMGGGPGSGIYRSTDGGMTWQKLTGGLPQSNMGKIGLAVCPQNPDIVYADIELDRRTGGFFMSSNRGESWIKQSDAVSGATGPHYYQELYASPFREGRVYLVDVRIQVTEDYGKTFKTLTERAKHSDNHAIAFRKDDPDYLLVGTDGGLYESFDLAATWRFIDNLPVTQYYKVAVDDAKPFYFVYGGTQDNGSHGGPSRTDNVHGIRNADWFKTLGADGHQSATEPGNPDIMYAEIQQGNLHRVDRITGEQVFIQPQPGEGEGPERFNWDSPILVSPHDPARIYYASQRVWRSDDRGDSWTTVSGDLTRNQERFRLPIMGQVQSWDNPWDLEAMSQYNTITSLAESPLEEGLLYAGTDDGLIQVSEDGGQHWRKVEVGSISGIPSTAFVNNLRADLFDASTVYACLDNHKFGDFNPYIIRSTDAGKSWQSIRGNLPDRTLVWRMVQDHVKKNLLFAATEFGIYCTFNGGGKWVRLKGGLPVIAFRDITIQRREDDLVGASFGRGFFILDDLSPLRELAAQDPAKEAVLYPVKDAWWYVPRNIVSSQGASDYRADNPPFGAVFTYYLKNGLKTLAAKRKESEKKIATGKDIPFPGWDALEKEFDQEKPQVLLVIKDAQGEVVNIVNGPATGGIHRVNWELDHASKRGIMLESGEGGRRVGGGGFPVLPGKYTVSLASLVDGKLTLLSDARPFGVKPLYKGALEGPSDQVREQFRKDLEALQQDLTATSAALDKAMKTADAMEKALSGVDKLEPGLVAEVYQVKEDLNGISVRMNGNKAEVQVGEPVPPTPRSRMYVCYQALGTTYGPTETHRQSLDIGRRDLDKIKADLAGIIDEAFPSLKTRLKEAGAPWIEGEGLIKD